VTNRVSGTSRVGLGPSLNTASVRSSSRRGDGSTTMAPPSRSSDTPSRERCSRPAIRRSRLPRPALPSLPSCRRSPPLPRGRAPRRPAMGHDPARPVVASPPTDVTAPRTNSNPDGPVCTEREPPPRSAPPANRQGPASASRRRGPVASAPAGPPEHPGRPDPSQPRHTCCRDDHVLGRSDAATTYPSSGPPRRSRPRWSSPPYPCHRVTGCRSRVATHPAGAG
jgi:hypothetical protein